MSDEIVLRRSSGRLLPSERAYIRAEAWQPMKPRFVVLRTSAPPCGAGERSELIPWGEDADLVWDHWRLEIQAVDRDYFLGRFIAIVATNHSDVPRELFAMFVGDPVTSDNP